MHTIVHYQDDSKSGEHENEAQKETPPRYDETNALHNHRQPRVRGSERRPGGVCYYSMIEYVVRRLWSNACYEYQEKDDG
jgi:hypothetical protein